MLDDITIPEIVLASSSPRRKMILEQVKIPFAIVMPSAGESIPLNGNFKETVINNAVSKAQSVLHKVKGRIVLGADTIVEFEGMPLGKPDDETSAFRMLSKLSGNTHTVHSGVAIINSSGTEIFHLHSSTRVHFRTLAEQEISSYIKSGEPFDKAGSYGIQERGALFIERIEGCFFNVMGLPIAATWELLKKVLSSSC